MNKLSFKKIDFESHFSTLIPYSLAAGFLLALNNSKEIPFLSYVLKGAYLSLGCLLILGFFSTLIVLVWNYLIANKPSDLDATRQELSQAKEQLFWVKQAEKYSSAGKFFADYGCIVPENNANGHYHFFNEDCPELNIKETPFYIYNKSTALGTGLSACPYCYGEQIKPDEPQ